MIDKTVFLVEGSKVYKRQLYIPRMEWAGKDGVIVQQLNRKQNESMLFLANAATGKAFSIHAEKDAAWIDILPSIDDDYNYGGWDWLDGGKSFLWVSEQDGWRHLYRMSRNGKESVVLLYTSYPSDE